MKCGCCTATLVSAERFCCCSHQGAPALVVTAFFFGSKRECCGVLGIYAMRGLPVCVMFASCQQACKWRLHIVVLVGSELQELHLQDFQTAALGRAASRLHLRQRRLQSTCATSACIFKPTCAALESRSCARRGTIRRESDLDQLSKVAELIFASRDMMKSILVVESLTAELV
jgi:hypothetical protein